MKIKTKNISIDKVNSLPFKQHKDPIKPNPLLDKLITVLSAPELKKVSFSYTENGMENLSPNEPCLVLMNHSSFIDLKIAKTIMKNRPLQIICTSDGFVGKEMLMRHIGCIPTQKFVTDTTLIKDMLYCINKLNTSILLFPEASYSFDGTATPLPESLGKCLKLLKVPVVFIKTTGAFLRDPLYNGLRLRDVRVSAEVTYLFSKEDVMNKSVKELNFTLKRCFSFDYFKEQKKFNIKVSEPFRTLGLERALYKCPACKAEGYTEGTGEKLICKKCGKSYTMNEYGEMAADDNITEFSHIPYWYKWERNSVMEEIKKGTYRLDIPVEIAILKDFKAIYKVGKGRLIHDINGFKLTGCDGKLNYSQSPKACYSLYADYFWYELGDMICIGDSKTLYYCFPENVSGVVAKTRLATEELYKHCLGQNT